MSELLQVNYPTAIIIPLSEWNMLTKRVDILEKERINQTETEEKEVFYSSTETAAMLDIHVLSLGRARKDGRIKGKMKNGREVVYSNFEIAKYKVRYPRYN